MAAISGTGTLTASDYKEVKWVGKTKGGNAITIKMDKAINLGNIDWTMAEKDDIVAALTFTAVYTNTDAASTNNAEPWSIEVDGEVTAGAAEVMLGVGVFYIGGTPIALTRGGGSFNVAREYRRINADGDRGPVEGRINMEGSEATLTMNALTILTRLKDLYPAMA